MADCATSSGQFRNINNRLTALIGRYRSVRDSINNINQTDQTAIKNGIDQLRSIASQMNNLQSEADTVWRAADWDSEQCPEGNSLYNGLINDIPDAVDGVNNAINTAQYNIDKLNEARVAKEAAATQKATTTQTVGGATGATGISSPPTPQGAGSSGANQLTEVTIGSKKPTTPQGVGATGAKGATGAIGAANPSADQLTGVSVTGKRIPQSSVSGLTQQAREQAAVQDAVNYADKGDWRVRLSLADAGKYLYQADDPGILAPLATTKGIVFPYTPSIQVTYTANYDQSSVQHSNYKIMQYQNSAVENLSLSCDFTAQSIAEANYVLAVIHFLRSVTKMFYGKDENPIRGTPPPLCYLTGLGQYQFNAHPLLITGFTYSLPTDVDYIRAIPSNVPPKDINPTIQGQRIGQGQGSATTGGLPNPPNFSTGSTPPTYIPTKINIQITASPVVARNTISNDFSLQKYATGQLLLGKNNSSGGGIW